MASTKQYKKETFSFRSLGDLVRKGSKQARNDLNELIDYKRDIEKGNYSKDTLENYKQKAQDYLKRLEEIKKFVRKKGFEEANEIRDVTRLFIKYGLLKRIREKDQKFEERIMGSLKAILKSKSKSLAYEKKDEKKLSKGKYPHGTFIERHFTSERKEAKEEKNEGKQVHPIEEEKTENYNKLMGLYKISPKEVNIGNSKKVIEGFVVALQDEREFIDEENHRAETLEAMFKQDLGDLKEVGDENVRNAVQEIQGTYDKDIGSDVKEAKNMKKDESKSLKESEKELGSAHSEEEDITEDLEVIRKGAEEIMENILKKEEQNQRESKYEEEFEKNSPLAEIQEAIFQKHSDQNPPEEIEVEFDFSQFVEVLDDYYIQESSGSTTSKGGDAVLAAARFRYSGDKPLSKDEIEVAKKTILELYKQDIKGSGENGVYEYEKPGFDERFTYELKEECLDKEDIEVSVNKVGKSRDLKFTLHVHDIEVGSEPL